LSWVDAHVRALETATPEKARALFRHAQVPGCEHFIDESLSEEEEAIICFATALIVDELQHC